MTIVGRDNSMKQYRPLVILHQKRIKDDNEQVEKGPSAREKKTRVEQKREQILKISAE